MNDASPKPIDVTFLCTRAALKRVAIGAVACALGGALYGTFATKWYASSLTVVPVAPPRSGLSSVLGSALGGIAAGVDSSLGVGADVERISAVLQSTAVTDAVIRKFDLGTRYAQKYQEGARSMLWAHCGAKVLTKPGLVRLVCEDTDPRFAQEMVSYFAEFGNQVFRQVGGSSAGEEVRFLEKHVAELRAQADATAEAARHFEEQHGIVDIETQGKAVVSALADLRAERIKKQLELDFARTFSAADEPTIAQLRSQIDVLDAQSRQLEQVGPAAYRPERAGKRARDGAGVFPAALAVPGLRAEYEQLYRNRKVAETTLVFALEKLESARAAEARDVSTFQILDPPTVATRHSSPKRMLLTLAGLLLGALAGAVVAWFSSREQRT